VTGFYELDEAGQTLAMTALAQVALEHWGLAGSDLSLIKYRENAVFKVITANGQRYALRIHRHAYHSDIELRSELQWINALDAAGIDVPAVVPTKQGDLLALVSAEEVPETRQVDVFAWVDGEQLGSVEAGLGNAGTVAETYRTIGQLAARLHNHGDNWTPPTNFARHAWDAEGLVGEQPFWGRFWELESLSSDERALILGARERVARDLAAYAADPVNTGLYGMIHADFVAENLMVDGATVRLIDFDDAGYGWHLFELATALYFEMEEEHYPEAFAALVAGYREHRALSDEQLSQLPLFLLARSFTYLGWVHTRSETRTAKELTPLLVEKCCALARAYLQGP
jgi:Ser/Thr protein kinase RdoA (MazF antagonist)